ncbi:Chemoreceptor zinc-binding domain-containing protein [Alteromonadaceae bacterium Bs31]|nr:Chemoreceptor zinc-binding domain-containing protein [Alteromonadaceae bacterium Bs31]
MNQAENQLDEYRAGSYISFSAGSASYVLPVSYVRYITALDTLNTRSAPHRNGPPQTVFDYSDETLVLYRLCDAIGVGSLADESRELKDLLQARRQDHIDWMEALDHSIRYSVPFTKATDPHKCAFGRWYDKYQAHDEELREIMAKFDAPHKRIHSLAEQLLTMVQDSAKLDQAIAILNKEKTHTLKELLNLFSLAQARLEDLVRPVVLVIEEGRKKFALQVDCIGDIAQFDSKDWLAGQAVESHGNLIYDGFFQQQEGKLFLNIVPGMLLGMIEAPD